MIMKIKLCISGGLGFIHLSCHSQALVSNLDMMSIPVNISELNFMCKVTGYSRELESSILSCQFGKQYSWKYITVFLSIILWFK